MNPSFKADHFDWRGGQVVHWELEDPELDEDLAQVHYPHNVLLDVGWYRGRFGVMVISHKNWDLPCLHVQCDGPQLGDVINAAIFITLLISRINKDTAGTQEE